MRELLKSLKVSIRHHPRLYSVLRAGRAVWFWRRSLLFRQQIRERMRRVEAIEYDVQSIEARYVRREKPVIFFNASSHPATKIGFHTAVGLLVSWGWHHAAVELS